MDYHAPARRRRAAKARCNVCGKEQVIGSMLNHIKLHEGIEERLLILLQDPRSKAPCKVIAVPPSTTGPQLMEIAVEWIDCGCGHLVTSNLEAIGAVGDEMTVGKVEMLSFDMGSPTVIRIQSLGKMKTAPSADICLTIAESCLPAYECCDCGDPAEFYCSECSLTALRNGAEDCTASAFFCSQCSGEKHAEGQREDRCNGEPQQLTDPELRSFLNSPRLGFCGYY